MNPAVAAHLAGLAPSTRRVHRCDLRSAARAAWPERDDPLDAPWHELTSTQADVIRRDAGERYAPGTANRVISTVRAVVRAAWRAGATGWDAHLRLLATLRPVRGSRLERGRALSFGEVTRLLAAAGDDEERALLALAAGAGIRRDELCRLRWSGLDWKGGAWHVRVLGKGNRERRMRLPTWAQAPVATWWRRTHDRRGFMFRWRDGRAVWTVVDLAAERAGLGRVAPHDLRRTFASLALGSGIGIHDLRRMMGHASIQTTTRYDKRPEERVIEEAAKLDALDRGPARR